MKQQWLFKPLPDKQQIVALSEQINVNPAIAAILLQRGITTFDAARNFFRPSLEHLHDPFLMKDMRKAAERLDQALNSGEKVLIYGDYDVDGTTAVATFFGFLAQGYDPETSGLGFYVPDRYSEGYGVSRKGIDYAIENDVALLITLDCGIKAMNQIAYAKENGIDVIVCDHHLPGEQLPPAYAVLDPKQKGCAYPFKELSGCGVGFKLLQAFCRLNEIPEEELLEFIDLVAVSIASDIVPIVGENRALTWHGLKKLNENPRPGLKALINVAQFRKPQLDISNIVFGIGPRINAAGRIRHARDAVVLLLAEEEEAAAEYAKAVDQQNQTRKDVDHDITAEALEMIENDAFVKKAASTVLYKEDWHKGVIGIVASRCIEKYYRPTIILTKSNGMATGSARSVHEFDIYEAISACSDLLEQYGGHMYAAGLTMKEEHIPAFRKKFDAVVSAAIREDQRTPKLDVDLKIALSRITPKFCSILQQMGPFGPGNMDPVFVAQQVVDEEGGRVVGGDHLKLKVTQGDGIFFEAIGFNMADRLEHIQPGRPFDICFSVREEEFNGTKKITLFLRDIKVKA